MITHAWAAVIPLAGRHPCVKLPSSKREERTIMSLQNHLSELERRHHSLDREIEKERLHPGADATKVAAMKRRKLILKDEIAKLRQEPILH